MNNRVAISIVLPAYNEERLIGRCLASLIKQDFSLPYEIIVVNNNSTDRTDEIAAKFPVKIISETMQSVVCARQRGLTQAQGPIVAGVDCDCTYPPEWLSTIYKCFDNPQVVACGGPAIAETNPWWAHLIYKWGYKLDELIYKTTGKVIYLGGYNFAFRKDVFLKIGGYRTYLDFGGDEWDPLQRLSRVGQVVFEPKALMHVSLRRYRVGFFRWWFVETLYYYNLNYWLAKIFKRTIIRAKPVRNI